MVKLVECYDCKRPTSPDGFYVKKETGRRYRSCKLCFRKKASDWKAKNRSRVQDSQKKWHDENYRDYALRRQFGLTQADYNKIRDRQNNLCAICGDGETRKDHKTQRVTSLAVDHCHKSGKIRELLCSRCNLVLGRVSDETALLKKMVKYLRKHGG